MKMFGLIVVNLKKVLKKIMLQKYYIQIVFKNFSGLYKMYNELINFYMNLNPKEKKEKEKVKNKIKKVFEDMFKDKNIKKNEKQNEIWEKYAEI